MQVPCCCVKALLQALAICLLLPALSNSKILHSCFSLWWYQTRKCVNWSARTVGLSGWHTPVNDLISLSTEQSPFASLSELQDSALGDESMAGLCQECQLNLDPSWPFPDNHLVAPQLLLTYFAGVTHLVAHPPGKGVWLHQYNTLGWPQIFKFSVSAQQYCSTCPIHLVRNVRWRVKTKDTAHLDMRVSFVNLQEDFMQQFKQCNHKYTYLIMNFFSGWVQVCPCRNAHLSMSLRNFSDNASFWNTDCTTQWAEDSFHRTGCPGDLESPRRLTAFILWCCWKEEICLRIILAKVCE